MIREREEGSAEVARFEEAVALQKETGNKMVSDQD